MSYVRNCKKCGQRISLRQMPGGHWVAFEVRSDMPHECFKENSKTNNFSKEERKMEVYEIREIIRQAISSKKAILGLDINKKFNKIYVAENPKRFSELILKYISSKKIDNSISRFYQKKYSIKNITSNFINNI